jgi:hypothetical protein
VVKDTTAPRIIAPLPVKFTSNVFPVSVPLGTATATDIVDGVLTPLPSESGPFNEGQYTITWSAKDRAGNVGTATQEITVTREIPSNTGGGGGGGGGSVSIAFLILLFLYNVSLLTKRYFRARLVCA